MQSADVSDTMPSLLLGVTLIFAFGEVSFADNSANDKCLKQQDKCQNCSAEYFTTKILLSVNGGVRNEVVKAQNVIMQNGADKVVRLFSQYTLTTTLNYFCCLSDEEKKMVAEMLRKSPQAIPQTIHFQGVQCMEGSDGNIIMFVLNEGSETVLKDWVSNVNAYLEVSFVGGIIGAGNVMVLGGFISLIVLVAIWRLVPGIRNYRYRPRRSGVD